MNRKVVHTMKLLAIAVIGSNVTLAETFKMKNEVIHANISFQHLNRICVKNDRIATVSGLENAFHFEKNEKTGEGFIRSTVENGHEPISISITTISGKTQDMLLNIVDGEPNVIELENTEAADVTSINDIIDLDDSSNTGNGYEESLIESMKQFILTVPKLAKLITPLALTLFVSFPSQNINKFANARNISNAQIIEVTVMSLRYSNMRRL